MVYLYYDFALQSRRLRESFQREFCVQLITAYLYYELVLRSMRFRVVQLGVLA
jgi:hypothetical protein